MVNSDEPAGFSELKSRVRQLENTAREAHVHLRDELAEEKARREVHQNEITDLQEELSDARQHIHRLEQQLVAPRDVDTG
jgi:predicted RNase H-like nuclease (RuvC/YqgF family)